MDIDGGMTKDLYESMAEGVGNSAAVVSFLTPEYEESENCKLELKYAKQLVKPIVPVILKGNGWRATGWVR